jgi:diamine N-acetyltransferase
MNEATKTALWRQFGAALDMLENAVRACPDDRWTGEERRPAEFWYLTYHTLFFLDYYFAGTPEGFEPPAPFTNSELDPSGRAPDRIYTRDELLRYLDHGRAKARAAIAALTPGGAVEPCAFMRRDMSVLELMLYTLRHVQHHAAQLHLILRQTVNAAPRWVGRTQLPLHDPAIPAAEASVPPRVTLREITKENLDAILGLAVAPGQERFVATNAKSLAQAHFFPEVAWFRAVYADEVAAGFVMLEANEAKRTYFLWRFMIDERHQRRGVGGRALALVLDHVRTLPGASEILTSVVPGEGSPGPFYEKLGFRYTGAEEDGEKILRLAL